MKALTEETAERFAAIALGHVGREYPNKLDQVLTGPADLAGPRALHPIFYGSFDWHSAVHSHWLLARTLRRFPEAPTAGAIAQWLDGAFTATNVAGELAFLARPASVGFERPYGWAWLLMLQAELRANGTAASARWASTMASLAGAFEARLLAWLPKAHYPVRAGTHGNSAFALALAARYAPFAQAPDFRQSLATAAWRWYGADRHAQAWEPSGVDFLSPTLAEAECLRRLLPPADFAAWFAEFLPRLASGEPAALFTPAAVSDRADGQIAHLDGLNLSRAWCFRSLATAAGPEVKERLLAAADEHLAAALPHLSDHYMGEHWLATFALLALDEA